MKTPVIIAARNEEKYIGRALDSLDSERVEPLVIANGCEDDTAKIAEGFGARVIELQEPGKLPAIQRGLRQLGAQALAPVLFMDADSHPLFPRLWPASMTRHLSADKPAVVSGLVSFFDGRGLDNLARTARRYQKSVEHRFHGDNDSLFGHNMAVRIGSQAVLEAVLDMDNIWPGEDRAMSDEITGSIGGYNQTLDPRSYMLTSARYHQPLRQRLKLGAQRSEQMALDHYAAIAVGTGAAISYHNGSYVLAADSRID
ncbi:MAG TPA: glycosyltransferase family A protein [Candidatus Saccharimonadales bacterium]|nr:glycosyltransferase family A protein [Candidatus Saccharimonadales bacterium]